MLAPHSTNFVPSSSTEPFVSEVVKPSMSEAVIFVEVTPPRKIKVDLQESKSRATNSPKGKLHDKPAWVCHFENWNTFDGKEIGINYRCRI